MNTRLNSSIPPRFENQEQSYNFFLKRPRGLDFSDPGTGKTRVQIDVFAARHKEQGGKALVLAPKSILRTAWKDDFKKFAPHLKTSIAYAHNRQKAFNEDADVYITNLDAAVWLKNQKANFFKEFHTLIIDESTAFKNPKSGRSKAVKSIVKNFPFRYVLTGTPNPQGITDVWHQVYLVDDGQRLGTRFFGFRTSVCSPVPTGPGGRYIDWQEKPGADIAVADLLSDITMRHKLEDCQDIPENHVYQVHYDLSQKQQDVYLEMRDTAVAMLENGELVEAVSAASVVTKILQIASGAVYTGEGNYELIEKERYTLICDLIEQRRHSVCFYNWTHQKEQLETELRKRKISYCVIDGSTPIRKREQYVLEFQQGYYQVCLAHPQSAGHGLTLTKATATIWSSPTYNLEHYVQANRRIYRAGQKKRTETILVTARNTVENHVYKTLRSKNARQESFLSTVIQLLDDDSQ